MSLSPTPKQPTSRRFMTWLLRSPFHVFMGGMLLITVSGRKSGRAISTPVNYVRDGDTLLITSKADRTWWNNVRGGAPVTLLLNGKTYQAEASRDRADRADRRTRTAALLPLDQAHHRRNSSHRRRPAHQAGKVPARGRRTRIVIEDHSPHILGASPCNYVSALNSTPVSYSSKGEALIELDISAVNGQAVVNVRDMKIDSSNPMLDVATRMLSQPLREMLAAELSKALNEAIADLPNQVSALKKVEIIEIRDLKLPSAVMSITLPDDICHYGSWPRTGSI